MANKDEQKLRNDGNSEEDEKTKDKAAVDDSKSAVANGEKDGKAGAKADDEKVSGKGDDDKVSEDVDKDVMLVGSGAIAYIKGKDGEVEEDDYAYVDPDIERYGRF